MLMQEFCHCGFFFVPRNLPTQPHCSLVYILRAQSVSSSIPDSKLLFSQIVPVDTLAIVEKLVLLQSFSCTWHFHTFKYFSV